MNNNNLYLKTKKMKNVIIYLIMIFTFISINSCCRSQKCKCEDEWGVRTDDCTPKHFGPYFLGGAKDYLYFEQGSYWIYKNNLTGETDSIYTVWCDTFVQNTTGTTKKWLSVSYTSIDFRLKSDKFNVTYTYDDGKLYPDVTGYNGGVNYVMYKTASFPLKSSYSVPFKYPFKPDNENFFQELIPTLTIQGKTYNEVAVFQIWNDASVQLPNLSFYFLSDAPTKYYWAKGVGLILIEQGLFRPDLQKSFTHKWELINYNLIK